MAAPSLPSTGSVVDYLTTKGQDSSFSGRRKLFEDLGLSERLGSYTGSPSQNVNFLRSLSAKDKPPVEAPAASPSPVTKPEQSGPISTVSGALSTLFNGLKPSMTQPVKTATEVMDNAAVAAQQAAERGAAANAVAAAGGGAYKPNDASGYGGMSIDQTVTRIGGNNPTPAPKKDSGITTPSDTVVTTQISSSKKTDDTTKADTGLSASALYPEIFGKQDTSEADLINQWLNSEEGKNFLSDTKNQELTDEAKAAAAKAKLEATYASDKTKLENNLAAHGLAFSGVRSTQVKALADSLAASKLDVDRDLASKLLDSDSKLRDAVLKGVADLVKEAKDNKKDAIAQLNQAGLAVVGDKLMPTISAQNLKLSQEKEQRLREAAAKGGSGNKLTLSEARTNGLPLSLVGQSEQDVIDSLYSTTPPKWFKDKAESEARASLTPEKLQQLWNSASEQYLAGAKESTSHAKAASYAKAAFQDIEDADVEVFANLVDMYVNGGDSYADAVSKATKDFTG